MDVFLLPPVNSSDYPFLLLTIFSYPRPASILLFLHNLILFVYFLFVFHLSLLLGHNCYPSFATSVFFFLILCFPFLWSSHRQYSSIQLPQYPHNKLFKISSDVPPCHLRPTSVRYAMMTKIYVPQLI